MDEKVTLEREWYKYESQVALNHFGTTESRGLTSGKVQRQREIYGQNLISREKTKTRFQIFAAQFNSPLVYILLIASVIVFALGDIVDGTIIISIVFLNAIIGAIQEGKAEDTLHALKRAVKSHATVLRDGKEITVDDVDLVPGDIILLKDGSVVPADSRIIESTDLKINQSSLTGESEPIIKTAEPLLGENLPFADRKNILYRGTYVISGLAKAVVVRTGIKTFIGKISEKIGKIDGEVPLKKNIRILSNYIMVMVLVMSTILFLYGVYTGKGAFEMFLVVVAIAVSAIPESLPVVVTLVLAAGVWRMSKKNVLVKRLQAVEALGQATVIAVDKTGTLTKNQMTVGKVYVNNRWIEVSGEGYNALGEISENGKKINYKNDQDLEIVGQISVFTAIANFDKKDQKNWKLQLGDPTEAALIVFGEKMKMLKEVLEKTYPKILEIPFSIKTKYHAAVNQISKTKKLFSIAGGPEVIIEKCENIWENGRSRKINSDDKKRLQSVINQMSAGGHRILALAANFRPNKNVDAKNLPPLTFVGFVGIIDAIRPEVHDSIKKAKEANMRVVMITGDHYKTAEAIGRSVGIYKDGDLIMTGEEMDQLDDLTLTNKIDKVTVFARVSPENKLRIVQALKDRGDIVAMTGDGINDALSLVAANLGVSMGQNGTEVAREASDIILTDDNFGNIISAAEEGRNIYWIIRKSILYLLSTNLGELLVITIAVFLGMPLPLLATQIIWLNLVTDTFLVIALSFDPKEKNLMSNTYRRDGNKLIDKLMLTRVLSIGSIMALVTLVIFSQYVGAGTEAEMVKAWTISLTTLTVFQWYNIFNIRSHTESMFSKTIFSNRYLLLGLLAAVGMHFFAIYTPFMQNILHTTGLNLGEWTIILLITLSVVLFEEVRKMIYRPMLKSSAEYMIAKAK